MRRGAAGVVLALGLTVGVAAIGFLLIGALFLNAIYQLHGFDPPPGLGGDPVILWDQIVVNGETVTFRQIMAMTFGTAAGLAAASGGLLYVGVALWRRPFITDHSRPFA